MAALQPGLSFKQIAEALTSFLEVTIHTLLCIRQVYPPTTFVRRRSHGSPVYQSRHPQLREYISDVTSLIGKEMEKGTVKRVTVVIKGLNDDLPRERYLFDLGYMGLGVEGHQKDWPLMGAPGKDVLSLMLRGFLIKLMTLDGQLEDNKDETTFAVIVETNDDLEPTTNMTTDGSVPPWTPALAADTLRVPAGDDTIPHHHEPLLNVKAVETGVIDIRLMVQECIAKTGVEALRVQA